MTDGKLDVLDLFTGIGGFAYGLHRSGMNITALSEIEEYPSRVLKRNFPDVPNYGDVTKIHGGKYSDLSEEDKERGVTILNDIDVICGGFPCSDISRAGKQQGGINGEKSGLWKEFHRCIKEIRPKYTIIENVENLRRNGLDTLLSDLAEIGYDACWTTFDTKYFGLPQRRRRVYIVGFRDGINADCDFFQLEKRNLPESRSSVEFVNKGFKWYFESEFDSTQKTAYFTRQRSDEFDQLGVASTIMKRDYKDFTDVVHQNGILRRVTPKERMLLQGFDKDWLIPSTNHDMFSCNGMSVPVVEHIGNLLVNYDKGVYDVSPVYVEPKNLDNFF